MDHGDRLLALPPFVRSRQIQLADKAHLDSIENQAAQLKQPPSFNDEQLTTLVSPSVSFFSPPTTYVLYTPCSSLHIMAVQFTSADKSAMQLRWDDFSRLHDRRGFNDHVFIARFLSGAGNEAWTSLPIASIRVAYRLLGLHPPAPQGRTGYVTAIRTRVTALTNGVVGADGADAPGVADPASGGAAQRAEPQAPAANGASPIHSNAPNGASKDDIQAMLNSFLASIDTTIADRVARQVTSSASTSPSSSTSASAPTSTPIPTSTSTSTPTATPQSQESTSVSSQSVVKETARRSQNDTINIDDGDSDSDAEMDPTGKSASRNAAKKYVNSCMESLRAKNCTLTQHINEYDLHVGWKNKRNRHEAVEVARLYDATATESMVQIKRRLIARYAALEQFDDTGAVEVFEHIQTSGHSLLGNSMKQQLHRAVRRSTIAAAGGASPVASKQRKPSHHTNNHHNNNSSGGRHGRESGGRPSNGTTHKPKSSSNGQGAGKNDSAGQQ